MRLKMKTTTTTETVYRIKLIHELYNNYIGLHYTLILRDRNNLALSGLRGVFLQTEGTC